MKELEGHRLANYFPAIEGQEFDDLVESIKKNGQLNPIILFEGKILDGKNRFRACQKLGVEPITQEYSGNDPLDFVIAENINRRHMSKDQLAILALKMLPEFEKQVKERKSTKAKVNAKNQARKENGDFIADSELREKTRKTPRDYSTDAREQAGKQFGISGQHVQKAKRIKQAVDDGELEKDTIENIATGKKKLSEVDKELHDKRFVKDAKEKEAANNKKLPNQYPKIVSDYLHDAKLFKGALTIAIPLAKEKMFSPEAMQFVKRLHNQIKVLMEEMENE